MGNKEEGEDVRPDGKQSELGEESDEEEGLGEEQAVRVSKMVRGRKIMGSSLKMNGRGVGGGELEGKEEGGVEGPGSEREKHEREQQGGRASGGDEQEEKGRGVGW